MRRVVHDLAGVAQRFGQLAQQLDDQMETTQEIWRDQRGQAFLREHLSPFKPGVAQLVTSIYQTHELFDELAKRLIDPEPHN